MIYLASDHGGYFYKEKLKEYLTKTGVAFKDAGTNSTDRVDASDYAVKACKAIQGEKAEMAILICKSGQMMSLVANRHAGIRAVHLFTAKGAKSAKEHINANVLCFGANEISYGKMIKLIKTFNKAKFLGGKYEDRIKKLNKIK